MGEYLGLLTVNNLILTTVGSNPVKDSVMSGSYR